MSKIAIQGNASGTGTLTIAAPNTNTDRTLTLPDATGTLNTSGAVNEVPAGSASAPAIYPTGDSNTGIFFPAADTIAFAEGGAEAMRIDSSGNLLIGTTSPTQTTDGLYIQGRVTATSAAYNLGVRTTAGQTTLLCRDDYYLRSPAVYDRTSGGAANVYVDTSGYLYRSTSSARYKTDIRNYDKGIETVSVLRPVYYKSNITDADGNTGNTQFAGLIAEEVAEAGLEEFIVRNSENQPDAIHYGNMVALAFKAIQELNAKVEAQAAEIAALKGQA